MAMELGIITRTKALPTELKEEILVRLPVKSLLRFRAVCKPWKSLIDSNSFKKRHLHFAQKKLSTLLLCRSIKIYRSEDRTNGDFKPTLHFLFPDTHEVSPSLDYDFIVDPTFILERKPVNFPPDDLPKFEKVGVANGMVMLRWNKFPVIWNPLSNHFKKINLPPHCKAPDDCPSLSGGAFTFGFDPKTHDYKVLCALFSSDFSNSYSKVTFQLYSLRNDSWKIVSDHFPYVHGLVTGDGFMDGKFYWFGKQCGYKDGSKGPGIVSFDFTNESFELTPLPRGLIDKDWLSDKEEIVVVTTRGCLELIKSFSKEGEDGRRCEIWGMGEDGLWSRNLGVSLPSTVGFPQGVSKDGQLVCSCLSRDHVTDFGPGETSDVNVLEILLFNPNTGGFKNLGYGSSRFKTCTFVESLFLIHK